MNKKTILVLGTASLLMACEREPSYPPLQPVLPNEQHPTDPAFSLDVPDVVEWKEGESKEVDLKARVPEPGHAIVTAAGLPAGATFDATTNKVKWTPGFDAADDAANPTQTYKSFPVKFTIRSDQDQVTFVTRTVYFIVRNVSRSFSIEVPAATSFTLTENKDFAMTVTIKSEDFPNGPFSLLADGLPAGAQVVKTSANQYQIKYRPLLTDVTASDRSDFSCNCFSKEIKVSLSASNPRGEVAQLSNMSWTIRDERQAPAFSGPAQVVQGTDGLFMVSVSDPNNESVPTIKLTKNPDVGYVAAHENPGRLQNSIQVEWKGVPSSLYGTTQDFVLESCVPAARSGTKCANYTVHVQVSGAANLPPAIDRAAWPANAQVFSLMDQVYRVKIGVRDQSNPTAVPTVRLKSSVAADVLNYANGEIQFTGKSLGMRTLEMNVTASNGLAVTETFSIEVLPATWAERMVAVEAGQTNEANKNTDLFKPAEAVNLPSAGDHALINRKMLIAGSEAIVVPANRAAIEKASAKITQVVLASPRVGDVSGDLGNEMQDLGLTFATVPGLATDYEVVGAPNSGLSGSFAAVHMAGKLTAVSGTVTDITLSPSSPCQRMVNYRKAGEADRLGAVMCPRAHGGKLLVSGFEWGDIDSNLLTRQWVSNLLGRMVK